MSGLPAFMLEAIAPVDGPDAIEEQPAAGEFVGKEEAPAPERVRHPFTPGVFENLDASLYHSCEAVGSGGVKELLRTAKHFRFKRDKPSQSTAAQLFGIATHEGTLEPDTFTSRVVAMPALNLHLKRDREIAAQFYAEYAGRVVLSAPDYRRCLATCAAIRAHRGAARLLAGARVEMSLFWNDARYGVPCKARWDIFNFGILGDLKTCQDASPEAFARAIGTYKYHAQAGHYCSGGEHALNESPSAYVFIAAETEPPHGVAMYELRKHSIAEGMNLADEAYARYAKARELGRWDGYPETIEPIDLPRWGFKRRG